MDTLCGMAMNIDHRVIDGEIVPRIEAVLTVMRKVNRIDGFDLVSTNLYETFRFALDPRTARALGKAMSEWADQAEEEARVLTYHKSEEAT